MQRALLRGASSGRGRRAYALRARRCRRPTAPASRGARARDRGWPRADDARRVRRSARRAAAGRRWPMDSGRRPAADAGRLAGVRRRGRRPGTTSSARSLDRPVRRAGGQHSGAGVEVEHLVNECVLAAFIARTPLVTARAQPPARAAGLHAGGAAHPAAVRAGRGAGRTGRRRRGCWARPCPADALVAAVRRTAPAAVVLWAQLPRYAEPAVLAGAAADPAAGAAVRRRARLAPRELPAPANASRTSAGRGGRGRSAVADACGCWSARPVAPDPAVDASAFCAGRLRGLPDLDVWSALPPTARGTAGSRPSSSGGRAASRPRPPCWASCVADPRPGDRRPRRPRPCASHRRQLGGHAARPCPRRPRTPGGRAPPAAAATRTAPTPARRSSTRCWVWRPTRWGSASRARPAAAARASERRHSWRSAVRIGWVSAEIELASGEPRPRSAPAERAAGAGPSRRGAAARGEVGARAGRRSCGRVGGAGSTAWIAWLIWSAA